MKVNLVSEAVGRITTIEQLLSASNINPNEWKVLKAKVNKREWQSKNKDTGEVTITELFQVFADIAPLHPLLSTDIKAMLLDIFNDDVKKIRAKKHKGWWLLANINLADVHLGRQEEKDPIGYMNTIKDKTMRVFDKLLRDKPDSLLLTNIGDYYNSELDWYTSSGKNKQDNLMNSNEMFRMGLNSQIELINTLSSELPTEVMIIWGNHDKGILHVMWDALDIYYSKSNVSIDNELENRKYRDHGDVKLWFSHGDGEREKDLVSVFSNEHGLGKYNYHTRWHFHEGSVKQYGKLILDTLASPAKPSNWERNKFTHVEGKIKGKLYDSKDGLISEYQF